MLTASILVFIVLRVGSVFDNVVQVINDNYPHGATIQLDHSVDAFEAAKQCLHNGYLMKATNFIIPSTSEAAACNPATVWVAGYKDETCTIFGCSDQCIFGSNGWNAWTSLCEAGKDCVTCGAKMNMNCAVRFYQHANYGGTPRPSRLSEFGIGEFDYDPYVTWFDFNDEVSSMQLWSSNGADCRVTIYEHSGFSGSSQTISESTSFFDSFNDKMSSFKIWNQNAGDAPIIDHYITPDTHVYSYSSKYYRVEVIIGTILVCCICGGFAMVLFILYRKNKKGYAKVAIDSECESSE